jgi:uncharacterized protein YbbC (DUF1343 family)
MRMALQGGRSNVLIKRMALPTLLAVVLMALPSSSADVVVGAVRLLSDPAYQSLLENRTVGIMTNPTGVLPDLSHIVDALHERQQIHCIFGPEHGFRGAGQAGTGGSSFKDPKTNLTVYAAYGMNHTTLAALVRKSGVDTLVFDIQDIGVRYYTFIWSLYDLMQAAALSGTVAFAFFFLSYRMPPFLSPPPLSPRSTCSPCSTCFLSPSHPLALSPSTCNRPHNLVLAPAIAR